jgi:DNA excision repair protein ERCC-3
MDLGAECAALRALANTPALRFGDDGVVCEVAKEHPLYPRVYDFLVAVAEITRSTRTTVEFRITAQSVAVALAAWGIPVETVLDTLRALTANNVPPGIEALVNGGSPATLDKYDFFEDNTSGSLGIKLRRTTGKDKGKVELRPHQLQSLRHMFGRGWARSGIIVLPCGAGKSLVGAAAAAYIDKSCICVCTSTLAARGWRDEFLRWTTAATATKIVFVSSEEVGKLPKDINEPCICITTYGMLTSPNKRSQGSEAFMAEVKKRKWGLMLLDEAHTAPAEQYRTVIEFAKPLCKLGLTATLVREDDKIADLGELIGPKIYQANWLDLEKAGHISKLECYEVTCKMDPEFAEAYNESPITPKRKHLLQALNPVKFAVCRHLINTHEALGDKIIVFCDNLNTLRLYGKALGKEHIDGSSSAILNQLLLRAFKAPGSDVNTILMSKVGDNSIDLPSANVMIQIDSHGGSRRQEAQRIGRILRTGTDLKKTSKAYTLVSEGTIEADHQTKRRSFTVEQEGYECTMMTSDDLNIVAGADATFSLAMVDKLCLLE